MASGCNEAAESTQPAAPAAKVPALADAPRPAKQKASSPPAGAALARTARQEVSPLDTPVALSELLEPDPEPAPAPAPEPAQPKVPDYVPAPEDVQLQRFVLARHVDNRIPMEMDDTFTTEDERIYAFLNFENLDAPEYQVTVHFEPADGPATPYGVTLNVGTGPRWRTWAFTRVRRDPGTYRCVVRNTAGEEIASQLFEIVDANEF